MVVCWTAERRAALIESAQWSSAAPAARPEHSTDEPPNSFRSVHFDMSSVSHVPPSSMPEPSVPLQFDNVPLNEVERIPCRVFRHATQASRAVAQQIAALIRTCQGEGRHCVLGLATGSTPVGVYNALVELHRDEGLSFQNVITFNLDEYYPMQPHELQSYVRFMNEHLFDHVDINPANVHIPDGTLGDESIADYCRRYEQTIQQVGGIDLQLLGIGRTGHIGFNEPGSGRNSRTQAHYARPHYPPRRGERLLRRRERAASGDHDGRRHDSRRSASGADGFWRRESRALSPRRSRAKSPPRLRRASCRSIRMPSSFVDEAAAESLTRYGAVHGRSAR